MDHDNGAGWVFGVRNISNYNGNSGGTGGADYQCRQLSSAAGLGDDFKAWISEFFDTNAEPRDRFTQGTLEYQLVDGTKVADNWTDLTDGTLDNGISRDEDGTLKSAVLTWANVLTTGAQDGGTDSDSCFDWTSNSGSATSDYGTSGDTGGTWTNNGQGDCSVSRSLYCFQQDTYVAGTHKKVFITANTYDGNLGGTSGADSDCATEAINNGLSGTYKAWIADTSAASAPTTSFTQASIPYVMVDGTKVADDWADLIDGALETGIVIGPDGAFYSGEVWTNVLPTGAIDGTAASDTYSNWTSNSGAGSGDHGYGGSATGAWTNDLQNDCDIVRHLYCFEQ